MIIEIRKAGFTNKGAELMLCAAMQALQSKYPNAVFTIAPTHHKGDFPYSRYSKKGLYPKAWFWRLGVQWGDFAGVLPRKLREMYGMILDREVDVVVDAAGFAYSDQWGLTHTAELAKAARRWRKRGTKVILLPQAFGPFELPKSKDLVKDFVSNADLIYAREEVSYQYLTEVVGEQDKVKMAPDFTNLVEGVAPAEFDSSNAQIAIVPNRRMIDKTEGSTRDKYVPFLIQATRMLLDRGEKPFLLVHEGEGDLRLAERISEAVGGIPIIREDDPLKIKGILGTCKGSVGSRFHGLVSALSQGVPALATGWSHKYRMLYADYGFEDGMLRVDGPEEELSRALDQITVPEEREKTAAHLQARSQALKDKSRAMWNEVFRSIEN
ncbi:polysaccharide pyruvyl transferase family protein [Proteobacteria bacterium 005FR1]|nr:polysaccharide pyruvyl transferase family protein [Proteobacteria bacterium 005FR1]